MVRPYVTCSLRKGASILNRPHGENLWHAGCLVKWSHCAHKNHGAYERSRPQTLPSSVHWSLHHLASPALRLLNTRFEPAVSPPSPPPPALRGPVGLVVGSLWSSLSWTVWQLHDSHFDVPSTEQASLATKNALTAGSQFPNRSTPFSHQNNTRRS